MKRHGACGSLSSKGCLQLWGGGYLGEAKQPMTGLADCEDHLLLKAWCGCSDPVGGKFLLPIPHLLEGHASQVAFGATCWGLVAIVPSA